MIDKNNGLAVRGVIEAFENSDAYDLIASELQADIDSLKYAYEVDGAKAAELRGRYEGLNKFFDLIALYKRQGDVAVARQEPTDEPTAI